MEEQSPRRRSGRADFRLLLASTAVTIASYVLLLPVVPLWAQSGGAGPAGAGATNATLLLVTVASQLAAPPLLRRLGHRECLLLGGALLGLPTFCYAITARLDVLLAVSAVRGVGFALLVVTGSALVARLLPARERARGLGTYGLAVGLPNLVFLPAGPWLAVHVGFGVIFAVAGALPLAGLALAAGMRVRTRTAAGSGRGGRTHHRARPAPVPLGPLALPFAVMMCSSLASSGYVTFLPTALGDQRTVAAGLFAYGVGLLTGRWTAGALAGRWRRAVLVGPGVGLGVCGLAALTASVAVAAPPSTLVGLVVAGALAFGLGFGAVQNDTLTLMFDRVPTAGYDVASTAWNMAYDAGTGTGSLALGIVAGSFGFPIAFAGTAALLAAILPGAVASSRARR